jgi:hypothetical protein
MDSGVKVVGGPSTDDEGMTGPATAAATASAPGAGGWLPTDPRSRTRMIGISIVALLGVIGTAVFGVLWAGAGSGSGSGQLDPAVLATARTFLTDLTNFSAKSVDADFAAITSMATGAFAGQADKFFNSSIRSALETALAESRGQIRDLFVQSDSGGQAVIYGVIDQTYVNNKITTPQSDVLRVLVNLQQVGSTWKISDVTVLEGATPGSTGTASGSAGSAVPGQ